MSFFNGSNIYRALPAQHDNTLTEATGFMTHAEPAEDRLTAARAETERLRARQIDMAMARDLAGVKVL